VRLHGWPFLRSNVGYVVLTGLGVVISLEASLSWMGFAQDASWGTLLAAEAAHSQPPLLACAIALLLAAAYFTARRFELRALRPANQG
jgi:ABC-type dipeptide/oligopeptide/nickel transport system permease subunit